MTKFSELMRMSALRQAIAMSAIFVVLLALAGVVAALVLRENVAREIDEELRWRAAEISAELAQTQGLTPLYDHLEVNRFSGEIVAFQPHRGPVLGELNAEAFLQLGFSDIEEHALFDDLEPTHSEYDDAREEREDSDFEHFWRLLVVQTPQGKLGIAFPKDQIDLLESALPLSLLLTGSLMTVVTLLCGLLFGLRAQRRMNTVTRALKRIAEGDLSTRLNPEHSRDDTDQLMRNIDATTADLERLMSEVKNLSVNLAHELRTPLARLCASLEQGLCREQLSRDDMADALEEAQQIAAIFNTVMRISGINSGKYRREFAPLALEALAREVGETYAPLLDEQDRELILHIDTTATVTGDFAALVQALGNLIQNALVHAEQGPITLRAQDFTVSVSDTGPGIAPAQRGRVLAPMYRLDSARHSKGFGLGLALVNAVAQQHGAALELRYSDEAQKRGLSVALHFQ